MGEVKVKGHNVSQTSYRLTFSFGSMSIGPPIPEIQHFQSLTLKIQGQGHSSRSRRRYTTLSIHILFVPCQSALPFLGYSYFKIWPWKSRSRSWVRSKLKVTTWVQHSVDSHPFVPCGSASHSWVTTFSKFDLENQRSRSWVRSQFKVTMWV